LHPGVLEPKASRYRILSGIQELGRCSVKELAGRLGWNPVSLYYHVSALVDAGLVRPAGRRGEGRSQETLYEPAAREITMDPSNRSPEFLAALWNIYRAVLRACERHLDRALREERHGRGPRSNTMVQETRARLSRNDLERLRAMIDETHRFASENEDGEAARSVYLVTACCKIVEDDA
jgi:predicted ArsR family transcriptional regulator